MAPTTWEDLIDVDLPPMGEISEAVRQLTRDEAGRCRGSARISTGNFYTDEEFRLMHQEEFSKPLP